MRRVAIIALVGVLSGLQPAFAFEAPFTEKVPNLLEALLEQRGASQAQIEATKRGVAAAATAEAGTLGTTVGRFAWLAAAARSRWVLAGLTVIPLVADAAYEWFTDDGETFADDPPVPAPAVVPLKTPAEMEAKWLADSGQAYKLAGWESEHHTCGPADGARCAASEAFIAISEWVGENKSYYNTFDNGSTNYKDFALVSYDLNCSQTGVTWGLIQCTSKLTYSYTSGFVAYPEYPRTARTGTHTATGSATAVRYLPPAPEPDIQAECVTLGQHDEFCEEAPLPELPNTVAYPRTAKPKFLPDSVTDDEAHPGLLSDGLNDMWDRASRMADYDGVPYDDPFTEAELDQIRQTHPELWPSLGDVASPVGDPTTGTIPWAPPGGGTDPGTDPDPDPDPDPEPGEDPDYSHPGLGAPELPEIPTIQQIMDPLLEGIGEGFDLDGLEVPTNDTCPTFEFEALESSFVFDAHCVLLEENKTAIAGLMLALFLTLSLMIILSA